MTMLTVNKTLKAGETCTAHRFELAGFGKAPFRFTSMVDMGKVASTCDYCSTGIRYQFWIASADGKASKVGCDCIHKVDDAGLVKQISAAERQLRNQKNEMIRQRKIDKKKAAIADATAKLPTVAGMLASEPHPNEYYAGHDKTMLDYVRWCLANGCGDKAANIINRIEVKPEPFAAIPVDARQATDHADLAPSCME